MKWIAPTLAYLAVGVGLFGLHNAWGALLGFHLAMLASLLLARTRIPIAVLLKSTELKWIAVSILLCGSSGVSLYFLWEYFGVADGLSSQLESLGLTHSNWLAFIVYFSLVNPFLEAYFWRGYLGNQTTGLDLYDFIYAGFHALVLAGKVRVGSIIFSLGLLVLASWLWRQMAREDRGLLAPVLGHMAADFTILLAVFWKA